MADVNRETDRRAVVTPTLPLQTGVFVCVAVVGGVDVTRVLDSSGEPQLTSKTCLDVSRPLMRQSGSGQVPAAAPPTLRCVARACFFLSQFFFCFVVFSNYVRFVQAWAVVPQDLSGMLLSVSRRSARRSHNVPSPVFAAEQSEELIAKRRARGTQKPAPLPAPNLNRRPMVGQIPRKLVFLNHGTR